MKVGSAMAQEVLIAVSERSKANVCDRSRAGVAGSNPAGDMDVFVVFVVQSG